MAKTKSLSGKVAHTSLSKRTSQGGKKPRTSTMNKHQSRGFKKYRGQGK
jgi:hypothetical protein